MQHISTALDSLQATGFATKLWNQNATKLQEIKLMPNKNFKEAKIVMLYNLKGSTDLRQERKHESTLKKKKNKH